MSAIIDRIINGIPEIDASIAERAQANLDNLTKPLGSLGLLEDLAKQICSIKVNEKPSLQNKAIFTFAADHGIADEKVSAYPKEVTAQMVYNFLNEGAAINVLARHVGARVVIADLGVAQNLEPHSKLIVKKINYGTKNMLRSAAMTREEAVKSIEAGIEIFENELGRGVDIVGTGEMGIGNTTASSAITACFTKAKICDITGKGAGLDEKGLINKINCVEKALSFNKPDEKDPIDVLAKVGGFEIGGLAGVMLASASNKTPVVIDGFISGAAALIAYSIEPRIKNFLIAAHCSVESGHKYILDYIGLKPLFDLKLRLGEGTGAALGINLADASIKILTQMATFKSAGVSKAG